MNLEKACSSVDRALDSDSKSQGFDSLHAYLIFASFDKRLKDKILWGCSGFDI
jgi:hypothetical protein